MKAEVLAACRRELQPGEHVVCALSGGGDSVALLHCLLSVQKKVGFCLSAAHFNHCLRGAESDEDEAFVRQLCRDWDVPLTVGRGDPAQRTGESPEEAARSLRYAFLMAQPGLIATAHHADDQIETVLLNLIRGTGLRGLCGMQVRQGRLFRPMLEVPKAEVERYLAENGLCWRTDGSNLADDAVRNRLRHHVLPLLRAENPALSQTVSRMTALLRQDEAFLNEQTEALLRRAAVGGGYSCRVLQQAPEVLQSRAIRRLLPGPKPSQRQVEQVLGLLKRQNGSVAAQLPGGVAAIREYEILRFAAGEPERFSPVHLRPGQTALLPGLTVTMDGPLLLAESPDPASAFAIRPGCDAITLRPRQPGDRLHLPGGTKTVKKLMIDRKIPAASREMLPVVEDHRGILAVYGLGCDPASQAQAGELAWIIQFHKEERKTDAG